MPRVDETISSVPSAKSARRVSPASSSPSTGGSHASSETGAENTAVAAHMGGGRGVRASGVMSARQPSTTAAVAARDTHASHPNKCSSTVPSVVNTRRTSASSSSHLTSGAREGDPSLTSTRGYRISRLRYQCMFPRVHTWTP